jgi:hypothetical protein
MGFRNQSNTRNNASEQSNDNWKATGFINVYVNVGNGNKRKLIGIPLKEQKAFERMLLERLQQEGGVEALQANLSITFELADKEVKAADLGW